MLEAVRGGRGPRIGGGRRSPARALAPLAAAGGLALLPHPALAQDVELHSLRARWRAHLEQLDPQGPDDLVVGGLHYDLLDLFHSAPGVYVGIGGYGALIGDRGGYVVAGGTVGWRSALSTDWTLDVGQFIGGGGGGQGAPVGESDGGLYLRPHVALERRLGATSLRFEVSHVNAPGGDLDSTQFALGIQGFDEFLTAEYSIADLGLLPANAFRAGRMPIGASVTHLEPSSGSERTDGSKLQRRILLANLAVERGLGERWYVPLELSGAAGGGVAGYTQFMAGLGYREALVEDTLDWRGEVAVGGGGGGGVDTGGGLLVGARAGLEAQVGQDWRLQLLAGYLVAPDGDFDGVTLTAGASWSPVPVELRAGFDRRRLGEDGVWADDLRLDPWSVQLVHKSYALDSSVTLEDDAPLNDRDVHLVGVGLEKAVADDVDLSLRAFTAYDGDLGGYHEGQLGLRYTIPVRFPVDVGSFYVQYHAGAAGGGKVRVGSGLVHNVAAGWRWRATRSLRLGLEAGHVESESGDFEGDSYAFTATWSVTRPLRPL